LNQNPVVELDTKHGPGSGTGTGTGTGLSVDGWVVFPFSMATEKHSRTTSESIVFAQYSTLV
jgi:hypothetical protein